jgi:hypothetical protein
MLEDEAGPAEDEAPDGAAEDDAAELPPLEPQAPTAPASATAKIISIQILRMQSGPHFQFAVYLPEGGRRWTPYGFMVGLGTANSKTRP